MNSEKSASMIVALVFILVVLPIFFILNGNEKEKWAKFVQENECKVVAQKEGTTGWSTSGNAVILPATKTWRCADGVEYTREE